MYTCAGANSVPVCVSPQDREASKSNAVCWPFIAPCCGFIPSDAPSPLRTPEDSQTYEHISRSILPVSARPVSVCQLPTFSDVTPVQARKSAGRGKNPFLFAMLFEKNIEIFSAPNPSVLCVFSICLPPFRACTGEVAQAGGSTQDTGRNVVASWTTGWEAYFVPTIAPTGAAFTTVGNAFELTNGFGQRVEQPFYAGIDASRVWGEHAGAEFAPTHVCIPVIIYLGNSA